MALDYAAITTLELLEGSLGDEQGSVYAFLDRAAWRPSRRKLKQWLCRYVTRRKIPCWSHVCMFFSRCQWVRTVLRNKIGEHNMTMGGKTGCHDFVEPDSVVASADGCHGGGSGQVLTMPLCHNTDNIGTDKGTDQYKSTAHMCKGHVHVTETGE
jgi:hypothetical protein